jgi:hypothetical protein
VEKPRRPSLDQLRSELTFEQRQLDDLDSILSDLRTAAREVERTEFRPGAVWAKVREGLADGGRGDTQPLGGK